MKMHLAGNSGYWAIWQLILKLWEGRCLQSYYYMTEDSSGKSRWAHMKKQKSKVNLFLDSGAFSAFTQGVEINIEEYIAFIKEHKQYLKVYSNLDVIGSAKETYKNQKIMEAAGLSPLPCYHYGEPLRYLERYIENYNYVALGGMVPISTADLHKWLDQIWEDIICDSKGMPKVKIHGFGLTSHNLMWHYPWYSVDSTSWVVTGRLGSIYIPKYREGKWNYRITPWKVAVSERSPSKKEAGKHFSTFTKMEQDIILHYLKDKGYVIGQSSFKTMSDKYELKENERWYGKAIEGKREVEVIEIPGLCNDYKLRDEINIIYYSDFAKEFPKWPYPLQLNKNRKGLLL